MAGWQAASGRPARFIVFPLPAKQRPVAFAYVDGYNLYYGLRRSCGRSDPGWRWLNLRQLLVRLVPEYDVERIYYFTAYIQPPGWAKAKRQKRFIRALMTVDGVVPVYGKYRSDPAEFPLVSNPAKMVEVLHTEEKQTDVNLALQLIVDGLLEKSVQNLVLVSNDSDQVPVVRRLRDDGLTVIVLNPNPNQAAAELKSAATSLRAIRPANVRACQFPDELTDAAGIFAKPPNW